MLSHAHLVRVARRILTAFGILLFNTLVLSQGSSNYLLGKNYVLRVSPFFTDRVELEDQFKPELLSQLNDTEGMLLHIKDQLYTVSSASDNKWFLAYYDPDRQSKTDLMLDFDLVTWFCHGHNVQLLPIEAVRSPMATLSGIQR